MLRSAIALTLVAAAAPALAQAHQHGGAAPRAAALAHVAEYQAALDRMHAPMAEGARDPDPDAAFVRGMIPHHQGAIDMARIALKYAKDDRIKSWANDVIREQQREIAEMEAWLKSRRN